MVKYLFKVLSTLHRCITWKQAAYSTLYNKFGKEWCDIFHVICTSACASPKQLILVFTLLLFKKQIKSNLFPVRIVTYVILKDFFSPPAKRKKVERKSLVKFFIRLCGDVFLDVLRWGDRYQLADLEKNGRRFHWFIDFYFKKAPFLRLNLKLLPRYLLLNFYFRYSSIYLR